MRMSQWFVIAFSANFLLAGCAYIQGVNDQKAQQKAVNSQGKNVPISEPAPPVTQAQETPAPASEAAKMIAPITN